MFQAIQTLHVVAVLIFVVFYFHWRLRGFPPTEAGRRRFPFPPFEVFAQRPPTLQTTNSLARTWSWLFSSSLVSQQDVAGYVSPVHLSSGRCLAVTAFLSEALKVTYSAG